MFKYISEILKQFTPAQKMLVLVFLLISIITISYIESTTKTPAELTKQVSLQRKAILKDQAYINNLYGIIDSLNSNLLVSNQDCNSRAMNREREFNKKMLEQQQYIDATIEDIRKLMISNSKKESMTVLKSINFETKIKTDTMDTIMHKGIIKTQQSVYDEPVNNEQTNNSIIEKLNNLKKKLKKVN
jgi:hypothetical protein